MDKFKKLGITFDGIITVLKPRTKDVTEVIEEFFLSSELQKLYD